MGLHKGQQLAAPKGGDHRKVPQDQAVAQVPVTVVRANLMSVGFFGYRQFYWLVVVRLAGDGVQFLSPAGQCVGLSQVWGTTASRVLAGPHIPCFPSLLSFLRWLQAILKWALLKVQAARVLARLSRTTSGARAWWRETTCADRVACSIKLATARTQVCGSMQHLVGHC